MIGLLNISCKQQAVTIQGSALGTTFNIALYPNASVSIDELQEKVQAILKESDRYFSTYRDDSEISRFNQHKSNQPFEVSQDLYNLVKTSLSYAVITEGGLDITTHSLSLLWGFGPNKKIEFNAPEQGEIEKVLGYTGYWNITVLNKNNKYYLQKKNENTQIDLSAVAKGNVVDVISEMLEESGVVSYMVELGGEIRIGQPIPGDSREAKNKLWTIGIERPDNKDRAVQNTVLLQSISVATSGDYRNFNVEKNKKGSKKYTHILDARSGRPVANKIRSVTVLAEKCKLADAMATEIFVMGKKKGIRYIQRKKLAAYIIYEEDNKMQEYTSAEFAKITGQSLEN